MQDKKIFFIDVYSQKVIGKTDAYITVCYVIEDKENFNDIEKKSSFGCVILSSADSCSIITTQ